MPEDIGSLTNTPQIPSRFLEALTSELACRLAVKESMGNPQLLTLIPFLEKEADKQYALAAQEDRERVPLRIYGDYTGYMSV